uniref:Uncharacterized protein n=1 Tax=Romanomermis culicivorax TaxID=13658 RepID=A0A915L343_ROMCU
MGLENRLFHDQELMTANNEQKQKTADQTEKNDELTVETVAVSHPTGTVQREDKQLEYLLYDAGILATNALPTFSQETVDSTASPTAIEESEKLSTSSSSFVGNTTTASNSRYQRTTTSFDNRPNLSENEKINPGVEYRNQTIAGMEKSAPVGSAVLDLNPIRRIQFTISTSGYEVICLKLDAQIFNDEDFDRIDDACLQVPQTSRIPGNYEIQRHLSGASSPTTTIEDITKNFDEIIQQMEASDDCLSENFQNSWNQISKVNVLYTTNSGSPKTGKLSDFRKKVPRSSPKDDSKLEKVGYKESQRFSTIAVGRSDKDNVRGTVKSVFENGDRKVENLSTVKMRGQDGCFGPVSRARSVLILSNIDNVDDSLKPSDYKNSISPNSMNRYEPKIRVSCFEDEYYENETLKDDEYLHTIKFGYSDGFTSFS